MKITDKTNAFMLNFLIYLHRIFVFKFMRLFVCCLVIVGFVGCRSAYNKIVKSGDNRYKYEKALEYYNDKQYMKSMFLFREILPFFKLTDLAQEVEFYYANNYYYLNDYEMASYYLKRFSRNYPNHPKAEICDFLGAVCRGKMSPKYNLDAGATNDAISSFQLFISRYPESDLVDSASNCIQNMRLKLQKKKFYQSKLYYDMALYNSAVVSFEAMLVQFPNTIYHNDVLYYILSSRYYYAKNSVDYLKKERYEKVLTAYHTYVDNHPKDKHIKRVEHFYKNSFKYLEQLKSKTNE